MEAIVERSCGLDVHQSVVLACLIIGETGRKPSKTVRRYGTTTRELKAMREWLLAMGCTQVAMESTGVYWRPVYAVLEGSRSWLATRTTSRTCPVGRRM